MLNTIMMIGASLLLGAILVPCAASAPTNDDPSPRAHVIGTEDIFSLSSLANLTLSADGRLAAYTESRWGPGDTGREQELWVVARTRGPRSTTDAPRRLTFGNFSAASPVWASDGNLVYFLGRDRAGRETPPHDGSRQVWRIRPDGSGLQAVTRVSGGVGAFQLGPDDRTLYYTTEVEDHDPQWQDLRERFDQLEYGHGERDLTTVHALDLVTWRETTVLEADRVIWQMALSPDGKRLGLITTEDNELIFLEGWSRVEVLDLGTGGISLVTEAGWRADHPSPYGWLEDLAWSADSASLAFAVAYDGYATRIWAAEGREGRWSRQLVTRPDPLSYAGGLRWRGAGRTLCWLGEARGRVRVVATEQVRDGRQGPTKILTAGDLVVGSFDLDRQGGNLTAIFETTTAGNDVYAVLAPDLFERRTLVNPQLDTWQLPAISHVGWAGADGDSCFGILELPYGYRQGDGPLPAIIELHGGPTASTRLRFRLWNYGRGLMAANGYALLSPNYHGSTGYGDSFLEKLIGRENEIEVTDITLGTRWLVEQGLADPQRLGVMGWSNGGYLTNCMIAAEPDLFAAASSGAGVLDMVIQWGTEDTPGHVVNFATGLPWDQPEHYRAASPLYNLGRVRTPTLIHVGGNDPRVPPAHSRALYRALRHYLDVPTELVVYPNEPHNLTTRTNRLAKIEWDLAWFRKYLGPADGSRTEQAPEQP